MRLLLVTFMILSALPFSSDSEDEEESRRQADVAQLLQQKEEPSIKRTKYDVWHNEDESLAQAMRPGGALVRHFARLMC